MGIWKSPTFRIGSGCRAIERMPAVRFFSFWLLRPRRCIRCSSVSAALASATSASFSSMICWVFASIASAILSRRFSRACNAVSWLRLQIQVLP